MVWWRRDKRPEKTLPLRLPCRRFIRNRITTTNIFTSKAIIKTANRGLDGFLPFWHHIFSAPGENHGGAGGHVQHLRLTRQHFVSKHITQLQHKASNSVSYICTQSRSWKSAKLSKARAVRPRYFTQRPVHVLLASSKNYSCDLDLGAKSGMF